MSTHRDLAQPEFWLRSSERSHRRRELLPKARREYTRRRNMSAALASAMLAGPGATVAAAQMSSGVQAAVAAESPAQRAIEIREGGLPLQIGSQGELVAHVQRALAIPADGIFGPQTDAAVRQYQSNAGLQVDGIVGLATWGALFEQRQRHRRQRRRLQRPRRGQAAPRAARRRGRRGARGTGSGFLFQQQQAGNAGPRCNGERGCSADRIGQAGSEEGVPAQPEDTTTANRRHGLRRVRRRLHGAAGAQDELGPDPGHRRLQLVDPREPGQGHADVALRSALGPQPRRCRHRGAEWHGDSRRCLRLGQLRRPAERLREHRLHHPHEPVLDVLRAHVALCHVAGRPGAAGPGDRLRRMHRQLHRPAPALRDAGQRSGAGSVSLPLRRRHDPRQELDHDDQRGRRSRPTGLDRPGREGRQEACGRDHPARRRRFGAGPRRPHVGTGQRSGGTVVARGPGCAGAGHASHRRRLRLRFRPPRSPRRPRSPRLRLRLRLRPPRSRPAAPVTPGGPGSGSGRPGHPGGPGRAGGSGSASRQLPLPRLRSRSPRHRLPSRSPRLRPVETAPAPVEAAPVAPRAGRRPRRSRPRRSKPLRSRPRRWSPQPLRQRRPLRPPTAAQSLRRQPHPQADWPAASPVGRRQGGPATAPSAREPGGAVVLSGS